MAPSPNWLKRRTVKPESSTDPLWEICPSCGERLYKKDLVERLRVCPKCGHHLRMGALDRIALLADGDFEEIASNLVTGDPLLWIDRVPYSQKTANDRTKSGLLEGVVTGFCSIEGFPTGLGVMDFAFRGGTMGSVVGEKITLLMEEAARRKQSVVLVCASELPDDVAKRVRGGRAGSEAAGGKMWSDSVVELTTAGRVVWEWHAWEHLDPERDGLTATQDERTEWTHANAVVEQPDGDLLVSFRNISTLIRIDRKTGAIAWKIGAPPLAG